MPTKQKGQKRKKRGGKPLSEMNFGAAESFIQGDWSALEGVQKFLDESSTMGKLNKIINKRMGMVDYINPQIDIILRESTRTVSKGKRTKKEEFVYANGKSVEKGEYYHIHYTKDLEEHYMTGIAHHSNSKLIYPKKRSIFSTYNTLNKQSPMILKPTVRTLTKSDYDKGSIIRYFAKKSNEVMSAPFEITDKEINKSPLYIYVTFPWRISGDKGLVNIVNTLSINQAKKIITNIDRVINPFQFYKGSTTKLNKLSKEEILDKLGSITTTQQTTTESNRPSTTTQTQTGPPPGVTTGGAGGAY